MRIYLASRYSRRLEMLTVAQALEACGHVVTSRWIHGEHEAMDNGIRSAYPAETRSRFAAEDYQDLRNADAVISFTEREGEPNAGRGGRHVEFGIALALDKSLIIVGHRENVFHCLYGVAFYATWEECFKHFCLDEAIA